MCRGFGCRSMALGFKLRALFVLKMGLGSRCSGRSLFPSLNLRACDVL